jgi:hypothetical protein
VVVLLKGNATPVMGFLVSQDEANVVVREPLADGGHRDRAFRRSEIEQLIITVSPERLTALDPDDPRGYHNYAEELTEKRQDPEARQTAIRLYQVAASLDASQLGRSSLLGMIELARTADEERRFRACAYLLDPAHDAGVLREPDAVPAAAQVANRTESYADFARALVALRQGRTDVARRLFELPRVERQLGQFAGVLSQEELGEALRAESLSPAQLYKVVLLELAITPAAGETATAKTPAAPPTSWREGLKRGGRKPLRAVSLETLTEFDPSECLFRDGRWVEP